MKLNKYILTVALTGLAMGPMGISAEQTIDDQQAKTITTTQTLQEPTTLQKIGLALAFPLTIMAIRYGIAGLEYVWDRSVVLAHEGGHALAALATGIGVAEFHVSKNSWGGGYVKFAQTETAVGNAILVHLAGPLCGAAAYFAWAKLWEAGRYLRYGNEHKDMNFFAKITGFTWASIGALIHLMWNLVPKTSAIRDETYGQMAGKMSMNDGTSIQEALKIISPTLGAAYPYIAWTGLAAFAGYSIYQIRHMCQTYEKELREEKNQI